MRKRWKMLKRYYLGESSSARNWVRVALTALLFSSSQMAAQVSALTAAKLILGCSDHSLDTPKTFSGVVLTDFIVLGLMKPKMRSFFSSVWGFAVAEELTVAMVRLTISRLAY